MRYCRQAIGLGRTAVKVAENLSDEDLLVVQASLRLAYRTSRGIHNTNTSITKLAKLRMHRTGLTQLPLVSATRPKRVTTESACLAVSSMALPACWFETSSALKSMNAGRYAVLGLEADGKYSLQLRLIDASDHFLEIPEYKRVIEVSPPMVILVENQRVLFGAADALEDGVGFSVENGRYICSVTSLRSGRHRRLIATLIRSDEDVPEIHQMPDLREA